MFQPGLRLGVLLLDEQPFVALAAAAHQHQREFAAQLFAVQTKFEIAALDLRQRRRVAQQFIGAAIPQHHAAAAVLALRNVALEAAVVDADDLPRASRDVWPAAPGSDLWEPPRTSASRPLPGENRSAVAWRRGAGRKSSFRPAWIALRGSGSGVLSNERFRLYSLSDMLLPQYTGLKCRRA